MDFHESKYQNQITATFETRGMKKEDATVDVVLLYPTSATWPMILTVTVRRLKKDDSRTLPLPAGVKVGFFRAP